MRSTFAKKAEATNRRASRSAAETGTPRRANGHQQSASASGTTHPRGKHLYARVAAL